MQHLKEPKELTTFSVDGGYTFVRVATTGAAKAWLCSANGIRISERPGEAGRLSGYIATRPNPRNAGAQRLERNGCVRKFVTPAAAARAALVEWT